MNQAIPVPSPSLGVVRSFVGETEGFTLLEVLLAFTIFAIVIAIVYGSYSASLRTMRDTTGRAEVYQMARVAMERIAEDLESAAVPLVNEESGTEEQGSEEYLFVGADAEVAGWPGDSLLFLSRAHLNFSDEPESTGRAVIRYQVQAGEEGRGLALYREDVPEQEWSKNNGDGEGVLLCDGLSGVNFTYYDKTGQALEEWDAGDAEDDRLPARVEIALDFMDPGDQRRSVKFLTGVILPVRSAGKE